MHRNRIYLDHLQTWEDSTNGSQFKDILHNVNLTEGQISVILNSLDHTLDRWEQSGYYCEEDQKVIDSVYKELEGSVDRFYNNLEKKQSQQPVAEWTD